LSEENYEAKKGLEITTLEKTIQMQKEVSSSVDAIDALHVNVASTSSAAYISSAPVTAEIGKYKMC